MVRGAYVEPLLFGVDGALPTAEAGEQQVVRRACVSAEFRAFAGGEARRR
jgi:hypothetical protein